jgi:hypothetical protein
VGGERVRKSDNLQNRRRGICRLAYKAAFNGLMPEVLAVSIAAERERRKEKRELETLAELAAADKTGTPVSRYMI